MIIQNERARSSLVERFSDKEEVVGSIPTVPNVSWFFKITSVEVEKMSHELYSGAIDLVGLNTQLNSQQEEIWEKRRKATQKKEELQARIENGESTNDKILDFAIMCHDSLVKEVVENYQELEKSLKSGQLILVIERHEIFSGRLEFGKDAELSDYTLNEYYNLGRITDTSLIFNLQSGKFEIPTGKYVRSWVGPENVSGNITIYAPDFERLNRPLRKYQVPAFEVKVGNEVRAFFEDKTELFKKMIQLL